MDSRRTATAVLFTYAVLFIAAPLPNSKILGALGHFLPSFHFWPQIVGSYVLRGAG
jgi:hypothetical protein